MSPGTWSADEDDEDDDEEDEDDEDEEEDSLAAEDKVRGDTSEAASTSTAVAASVTFSRVMRSCFVSQATRWPTASSLISCSAPATAWKVTSPCPPARSPSAVASAQSTGTLRSSEPCKMQTGGIIGGVNG